MLLAGFAVIVCLAPAQAAHRHYHHSIARLTAVRHAPYDWRFAHRRAAPPVRELAREPVREAASSGFTEVHTRAGARSLVAAAYASRFQGFINDLESRGATIRSLGCLSSGHMANSRHHWGGACDIDQTARNRAGRYMYHLADLAAKWGLTDGCTFGDCGHIEVPGGSGMDRVATRGRTAYAQVGRRHRHRIS